MKYIKKFENNNTQEFVKLFSHIRNFLNEIARKHDVFILSDISDYSFCTTKYEFSNFRRYKMLSIKPLNDNYFNIIATNENDYYYNSAEIKFKEFILYIAELFNNDGSIPTNKIPYMIEKINKENFEVYLDSKKYNL